MESIRPTNHRQVIIFGTGGHAKVVADILLLMPAVKVLGFVDLKSEMQSPVPGIPYLGAQTQLTEIGCRNGIIAVGDNALRAKIETEILSLCPDFKFVIAIHPNSSVSPTAILGAGTTIMPGACVNSDVKIGQHCIINTGAIVEHDSSVGCFSSIGPRACLGGGCSVGDFVAVGLGASVSHQIKIGADSVVGTGSAVVSDIPNNTVSYGVPAQVVRNRNRGDRYL